MEIDKSIVIVAVILILVLGVFALANAGDSGSASNVASYAGQYAGGGCGR